MRGRRSTARHERPTRQPADTSRTSARAGSLARERTRGPLFRGMLRRCPAAHVAEVPGVLVRARALRAALADLYLIICRMAEFRRLICARFFSFFLLLLRRVSARVRLFSLHTLSFRISRKKESRVRKRGTRGPRISETELRLFGGTPTFLLGLFSRLPRIYMLQFVI